MRKMGILIVLVVLVLCCIAGAIVLYNLGLWSFPLPKRDFATPDLLLTIQDLGEGWSLEQDEGWPMYNSTIVEQWNRQFVYSIGGQEILRIGHFVYRCDNKQHARSYLRESRLYFGKYTAPPELSALFQPRYTDEWMLFEQGGYAAVYDEFYIFFRLHSHREHGGLQDDIRDGILSYEQIAHWLYVLDERAGRLLGQAGNNH